MCTFDADLFRRFQPPGEVTYCHRDTPFSLSTVDGFDFWDRLHAWLELDEEVQREIRRIEDFTFGWRNVATSLRELTEGVREPTENVLRGQGVLSSDSGCASAEVAASGGRAEASWQSHEWRVASVHRARYAATHWYSFLIPPRSLKERILLAAYSFAYRAFAGMARTRARVAGFARYVRSVATDERMAAGELLGEFRRSLLDGPSVSLQDQREAAQPREVRAGPSAKTSTSVSAGDDGSDYPRCDTTRHVA